MKIRLYNARIMTMAEGCSLLQGEIWVENDRILYVGDGTDLDAFCKRNVFKCPIVAVVLSTTVSRDGILSTRVFHVESWNLYNTLTRIFGSV